MTPLENLEQRVGAYLGHLGLDVAHRPGGVTVLDAGDVPVFVTCFEQDDATWCRITALLLTEVEPDLKLLHHLLTLSHDVLLGSFQLFEDGVLAFAATLHGHTLDADAFARTLRYVAGVADSQLPRLRALTSPGAGAPGAGGRRAARQSSTPTRQEMPSC